MTGKKTMFRSGKHVTLMSWKRRRLMTLLANYCVSLEKLGTSRNDTVII